MSPENNYGRIADGEPNQPEKNYGKDFWDNPENVLRLIDLIFFFQEEKDVVKS